MFGGDIERRVRAGAHGPLQVQVCRRHAALLQIQQGCAEFLLRAYPDLQITYFDKKPMKVASRRSSLCLLMETLSSSVVAVNVIIDRFLMFYYAHPGFRTKILVITSVQIFMLAFKSPLVIPLSFFATLQPFLLVAAYKSYLNLCN